jgi:hypothetical protein
MSKNKPCRKKKPNDAVACSVVIPKELQEAVIRKADREDRSFSSVVRLAVAAYVGAEAN